MAIRLLSFLINAIIIRFVSIEYIGVVNVRYFFVISVFSRLTLLVTTTLFLTREPIRKACLDQSNKKWVAINQLSWLSLFFKDI